MFAAINAFLTRAVSGYFLNKSLRFRSSASAYLGRTPSVTGSQTTWTWSGWFKRGALGFEQHFFAGGTNGLGGWNRTYFGILPSDKLFFGNQAANFRVTTQVFRDPSAWYHLIAVFDSSNATDADRIRIYINGTQVTAFDTNASVPINTASAINSTTTHQIGWAVGGGAALFFDGELAEVNFVDGQALAPTAFGAFSTYNQWLPKKYAGTYGTNGFYLPFNATSATSYAGSFNGSTQYLTVPDSTAFTLGSNAFTFECWINISNPSSSGAYIAGQCDSAQSSASTAFGLYVSSASAQFESYSGATYISFGTAVGQVIANTWVHLAWVRDTGTNTLRIYVNGVQKATLAIAGATALNNSANLLALGQNGEATFTRGLAGYISNFRLVNGTCLYPSGTTFTPPTAPLTAITNTSLLTLQNATIVDNSTNAFTITNNGTVVTSVQSPFLVPTVLTADSSGNGNNWTANNISLTAGSTYDSLTDVPTLTSTTVANYAVLNPLDKGAGMGVTDGNLTATVSSAGIVLSTIGVSTGKWYWEMTRNGGADCVIGIANASVSRTAYLGSDANGWGYIGSNGNKVNAATSAAYGSAYASGVVVGVALDMTAGTLTFYRNNVSQGTAYSSLTGTLFAAFGTGNATDSVFANFGQQPFTYTPPTGFLALNTYNI